MVGEFYNISPRLLELDRQARGLCAGQFAALEEIKEYNQLKMLRAFTDCGVGGQHLVGTTGYGTDDPGRDKLEQVFARAVGAEASLFRQSFLSGTHTLSVALFGVLRPGDRMVAAAGTPYDTLLGVIGLTGDKGWGSLKEWGVQYDEVPLKDGRPDLALIGQKCKGAKMCYIQRSRGYSSRDALSLADIGAISRAAKEAQPDIIVMVDNCYGEFTQKQEPTVRGGPDGRQPHQKPRRRHCTYGRLYCGPGRPCGKMRAPPFGPGRGRRDRLHTECAARAVFGPLLCPGRGVRGAENQRVHKLPVRAVGL